MKNLVNLINEKTNMAEESVVFYHVDKEGTLTYLAKKGGKYENITVRLEDMHVSIQKGGNTKTGSEWLLNTLPGDHKIRVKGRDITNMRGSCQGCCDGCESFCYAINGARQHHNSVMPSVIKNLILYRMDPDRFEKELNEELKTYKFPKDENGNPTEKVFRWHASGEIEDRKYLDMMMRVAENRPTVHFYSYTKRFSWIKDYLDVHGDFPSNFVWNLSVWKDNLKESGFPEEYLSKVQLFEWCDEITEEEYYHTIHCRSVVVKDGHKKGHLDHNMNCRKCGLCWKGLCKGRTIKVGNH